MTLFARALFPEIVPTEVHAAKSTEANPMPTATGLWPRARIVLAKDESNGTLIAAWSAMPGCHYFGHVCNSTARAFRSARGRSDQGGTSADDRHLRIQRPHSGDQQRQPRSARDRLLGSAAFHGRYRRQEGRSALHAGAPAVPGGRGRPESGGRAGRGASSRTAISSSGASRIWWRKMPVASRPSTPRKQPSASQRRSCKSAQAQLETRTDRSRLYRDPLPDRRPDRPYVGDRGQHGQPDIRYLDHGGQPGSDVRGLSDPDAPCHRVARGVFQARRIRRGEDPTSPPGRENLWRDREARLHQQRDRTGHRHVSCPRRSFRIRF